MSAIAAWYHNQYGVWRRTRRLQMAPFLAEGNPRVQGTAQDAVVINMGDAGADAQAKKKSETLFGPAIGAVAPGPDWAVLKTASATTDELTPEIVQGWINKSKDPAQPTTTLQALVNLKRPTLRLSPLTDDPQHHAIEFQYDCDAPRCSIQVVILPAAISVYSTVTEGGFGRTLKLEDDATLELAKYELHAAEEAKPEAPTAGAPAAEAGALHAKKRFPAFPFRKRSAGRSSDAVTAGPALQVVDVDQAHGDDSHAAGEKADEGGVRVAIILEAVDEEGHSLQSVNSQVTYLHVVRTGQRPEGETEEDTRPWVVKVVKREATIGPHTFHLHEIYGLTSSAAPAPATYPPTTDEAAQQAQAYDFAGQECVLCLSSPREVVLLPCRHLVACKDCAVNMVEFGAGGTLQQPSEAAPATTAAPATQDESTPAEEPHAEPAADADGTGALPADGTAAPAPAAEPAPAAPAAPVAAPRRKRKPKGWFCPVCRQPYTSLLRITTTAPDAKDLRASEDEPAPPPTAEPALPEPAARPSFFRQLTARARAAAGTAPPASATVPPTEVPAATA